MSRKRAAAPILPSQREKIQRPNPSNSTETSPQGQLRTEKDRAPNVSRQIDEKKEAEYEEEVFDLGAQLIGAPREASRAEIAELRAKNEALTLEIAELRAENESKIKLVELSCELGKLLTANNIEGARRMVRFELLDHEELVRTFVEHHRSSPFLNNIERVLDACYHTKDHDVGTYDRDPITLDKLGDVALATPGKRCYNGAGDAEGIRGWLATGGKDPSTRDELLPGELTPVELRTLCGRNGKTYKHYANLVTVNDLVSAAEDGNVEDVRYYLSSGVGVNETNRSGDLPIVTAASEGHTKVVQAPLEHRAIPDQKDSDGNLAIVPAIRLGYTEVVQALLEHKADPNREDRNGDLPIVTAADKGTEVVQALLEHKADPNREDRNGDLPISTAADKGHTEVVQALLAHKADPNQVDGFGHLAVMMAADKGHIEVVQALLKTVYIPRRRGAAPLVGA